MTKMDYQRAQFKRQQKRANPITPKTPTEGNSLPKKLPRWKAVRLWQKARANLRAAGAIQ